MKSSQNKETPATDPEEQIDQDQILRAIVKDHCYVKKGLVAFGMNYEEDIHTCKPVTEMLKIILLITSERYSNYTTIVM